MTADLTSELDESVLDRTLSAEELEDLTDEEPTPTEVTYQSQDFPVDGLVKRLNDRSIIVPQFGGTDTAVQTAGFQRGFVWSKAQMDRFIESLLLGYPIPGIFLVRQSDKRLLVLDGQQRLETLRRFYGGIHDDRTFRLQAVGDRFKGKTCESLDSETKRMLNDSYIQATVVTSDGTRAVDEAIYQIFERLNSGGTQLTPHEIRVALYSGTLMTAIERLNENSDWRSLFGKKSKRIRDHEVILRILALKEDEGHYSKPLKGFLNRYAQEHRDDAIDERVIGGTFREAARVLNGVGPAAVRGGRSSFNAAIAEAVFVATMEAVELGRDLDGLESGIAALHEDRRFQLATTSGTSSRDQVEARLAAARERILGD